MNFSLHRPTSVDWYNIQMAVWECLYKSTKTAEVLQVSISPPPPPPPKKKKKKKKKKTNKQKQKQTKTEIKEKQSKKTSLT